MVAIMGIGLGTAGAFCVAKWGNRFGFSDRPSARSSHQLTTPKGGGVGISAAFGIVAWFSGMPVAGWLPAVGLSVVSLVADRYELPAKFRLVLQTIAAAAVCTGAHLSIINPAEWGWGVTAWLVLFGVVFLVGTANHYNFMDGINGIAGLTGIIAFGMLTFHGWVREERFEWILTAAALSAACAGYFPWNFPRARVFMGDVGSVFLGFVFALFVLKWSKTLGDFLMFSALLFPFYADELYTLIVRLKDGDSLTKPHRRHVYQILVNQMGYPHWLITIVYGTMQLSVAWIATWISPFGWKAETALMVGFSLMFCYFGGRVRKYEFPGMA